MTRYEKEIIRCLDLVVHKSNQRPFTVFTDWLDMMESCLQILPSHMVALADLGTYAAETNTDLWTHIRKRYSQESYHLLSQAFGYLLESSEEQPGTVTYADVLGSVYMAWEIFDGYNKQYFTPWPVAEMMAKLTIDVEEIHQLVKNNFLEAVKKSPLTEAMMVAGMIFKPAEGMSYMADTLLPTCIQHFKPVRIADPGGCGSGTLLLAAASTLPRWMVEMGMVQFYGQDIDNTCVQMARINTMLYGMNFYGLRLHYASQPLMRKAVEKIIEEKGDPIRVGNGLSSAATPASSRKPDKNTDAGDPQLLLFAD